MSALVSALAGIGGLFLEGRVLMDLWRWFVVPLGVRSLTYWQALGCALVVSLLVKQYGVERDTEKYGAEVFLTVLAAWGLGWLFSLGMQP